MPQTPPLDYYCANSLSVLIVIFLYYGCEYLYSFSQIQEGIRFIRNVFPLSFLKLYVLNLNNISQQSVSSLSIMFVQNVLSYSVCYANKQASDHTPLTALMELQEVFCSFANMNSIRNSYIGMFIICLKSFLLSTYQ